LFFTCEVKDLEEKREQRPTGEEREQKKEDRKVEEIETVYNGLCYP